MGRSIWPGVREMLDSLPNLPRAYFDCVMTRATRVSIEAISRRFLQHEKNGQRPKLLKKIGGVIAFRPNRKAANIVIQSRDPQRVIDKLSLRKQVLHARCQ